MPSSYSKWQLSKHIGSAPFTFVVTAAMLIKVSTHILALLVTSHHLLFIKFTISCDSCGDLFLQLLCQLRSLLYHLNCLHVLFIVQFDNNIKLLTGVLLWPLLGFVMPAASIIIYSLTLIAICNCDGLIIFFTPAMQHSFIVPVSQLDRHITWLSRFCHYLTSYCTFC